MKTILPTLKEKKRYLAYEIMSDKQITFNNLEKDLKRNIINFLGELNYAKAGIILTKIYKNNKGILKLNNKYLNYVRAALTLTKKINSQNVIIKTNYVSGSIKKVKNYI